MDQTYVTLFYVIFGGYSLLLVAAALSDAHRFIIPNTVVLLLAGLFVAAGLVLPVETDWLSHLGAAGAVLAVGAAIYYWGKMGGGDVKLLTVIALWTGFEYLPTFLLYVAIMGGVVSILLMVVRRVLMGLRVQLPRFGEAKLPRVLLVGEHIPYALAISPIAIYLGLSMPHLGAFIFAG